MSGDYAVFVVRRDATVVYSNRLDEQGEWVTTPGAPAAVMGERDRRWSEQEPRVFASSTGRTLQTIETLPAEMRDAARNELGAIADLARPLLHPAADTAVRKSLGALWPAGPVPAVRASAARARSTTPSAKPTGSAPRGEDAPRTSSHQPQRKRGLNR
ncbi:hypothetical protein [Streptomyces sp. NPDC056399]|uniref:hypothetical protein n=1 Tax=Streptomyces sp. NPDC056399 TaxID=3345807 RepID=UPI0035DBEA8B